MAQDYSEGAGFALNKVSSWRLLIEPRPNLKENFTNIDGNRAAFAIAQFLFGDKDDMASWDVEAQRLNRGIKVQVWEPILPYIENAIKYYANAYFGQNFNIPNQISLPRWMKQVNSPIPVMEPFVQLALLDWRQYVYSHGGGGWNEKYDHMFIDRIVLTVALLLIKNEWAWLWSTSYGRFGVDTKYFPDLENRIKTEIYRILQSRGNPMPVAVAKAQIEKCDLFVYGSKDENAYSSFEVAYAIAQILFSDERNDLSQRLERGEMLPTMSSHWLKDDVETMAVAYFGQTIKLHGEPEQFQE